MAIYYCPCCNVRKVSSENELCSSCQDPYQSPAVPAAPVQPQLSEPATMDADPPVSSQAAPSAPAMDISADNDQPTGGYVTISRGRRSNAASSAPVYQPQQTYRPASAPAAPAPTASANTVSTSKKNAPQAEGIVKNITAFKDRTNVAEKWFRSLFLGVPFPIGDDAMEFQVFQNWNGTSNSASGYTAEKVVVYGTMTTGRPVQDNSVRVYGCRDKGNNLIASRIENTTDGTFTMFKPEPISASVIRFVTLAAVALIVLLFINLGNVATGSAAPNIDINVSNILSYLLYIAIGGFAIVYCFGKVKSYFGRNWSNFFGYLIALISALAITYSLVKSMFGM